ncbi:unnamed protein product [Cuscuta campestris]|uniref:Uncharacterized protein n=1 Tax=Cuscuta campestris TaxID=132261 RepID=A0A484K702_9ASTE|nr:unnamed protein product [Cuscuta campestris]
MEEEIMWIPIYEQVNGELIELARFLLPRGRRDGYSSLASRVRRLIQRIRIRSGQGFHKFYGHDGCSSHFTEGAIINHIERRWMKFRVMLHCVIVHPGTPRQNRQTSNR